MFALLDASVIYAGIVGRPDGASALLLATIRLGGIQACTVENAMQEAGYHLLGYFSQDRLKVQHSKAERELKSLRELPTFTVFEWITAPPDLLPDNPKDAYLVEASRRHRPRFLLTFDKALLDLEHIDDSVIVATPSLVLSAWDSIDEGDF